MSKIKAKKTGIGQTEIKLLTLVAGSLSKELKSNKEALHVRGLAFDHLLDGEEEVQVQIIITRDKDDFLNFFQTEIMHRG